MPIMYDSADGNIPAGAQFILVPTDGQYAAGVARVKANFPNATYQTYSIAGQVLAEWIDVEPGGVWPPETAVAVFVQWKGRGCKGFYSAISTQQAIRENFNRFGIVESEVQWFDANWTGVPHIDAGNVETQFEDQGAYDESEIPAPTPPPVVIPPVPPPAPPVKLGTKMLSPVNVLTDAAGNGWGIVAIPAGYVPVNVSITDANPGAAPAQPDGEKFDVADAHFTTGAPAGYQKVEVVNGQPNIVYGVEVEFETT